MHRALQISLDAIFGYGGLGPLHRYRADYGAAFVARYCSFIPVRFDDQASAAFRISDIRVRDEPIWRKRGARSGHRRRSAQFDYPAAAGALKAEAKKRRLCRMAYRPDPSVFDRPLTKEQIEELYRKLSRLSAYHVQDAYRHAYEACRMDGDRLPRAASVQSAWKVLRAGKRRRPARRD